MKRILSPNRQFSEALVKERDIIPSQCDIVIIGGGAIGSSIAYWLKQKIHREEFSVVVIEKDPTVRLICMRFLILMLFFNQLIIN